ncbi:MAG: MBL fold metallo-hydrolase [Anaerolineae bacterium]|nr:MBL fold metallo-hydrolase [Anaerolineae bacterium]
MSEFHVTFWGVRGGYPVPGEETVEFGGNTTCLQVCAGPHLIIIDAGTGIIGLGEKLAVQRARDGQPIRATLLFTHGHHDHTQGLSFFAPLQFPDSSFFIFGPRLSDASIQDVLTEALLPSSLPQTLSELLSVCTVQNVQDVQVLLLSEPDSPPLLKNLYKEAVFVPPWAVKIEMYLSHNHPKGGAMCYRIEYRGKRLVFATDTEGYEGGDTNLIAFARGADLLVHDAEYVDKEYTGPPFCRQGWGHSTWRIAVEVGQKADVKRLALTHHHANHDDEFMRQMERDAQSVFDRSFIVREGMTIAL